MKRRKYTTIGRNSHSKFKKNWLQFDDAYPYLTVTREGSDGWFAAACPAHTDDRPSLGFKEGQDGELVVHCHAGCEIKDIREAIKEMMI